MQTLGLLLCLLCIIGGAVKIYIDATRREQYITIFSLFYLFECLDLFVPSILVYVFNLDPPSIYVPIFSSDEYAFSMVVAGSSFLLFWCGYTLSGHNKKRRPNRAVYWAVNTRKITKYLKIFTVIFIGQQLWLYSLNGGFVEYITTMAKYRYTLGLSEKSLVDSIVIVGGSLLRSLVLSLITILFIFRDEANLRYGMWPWFFLAFVVCISTFYRGPILVFVMMLAAAEQFRISQRTNGTIYRVNGADFYEKGRLKLGFGKIVVFSIAGITLFTSLGAFRTYLSGSLLERSVTSSSAFGQEMARLVNHGGYFSLTHITSVYERTGQYLNGYSIYSQLFYRFVPRAFWEAKPSNYGAYDINVDLGYPSTSLSAITVPGEMFANFGVAGLVIGMLLVGFMLGRFQNLRSHPVMCFFYVCTVGNLIISIGWFSTTGFMSWVISILALFIFLRCRLSFVRRVR